ncbi:MAG TPA: glucose-6-phosphate dehydrogenase assembly protein OpcA [Blastocatellia bacterium]
MNSELNIELPRSVDVGAIHQELRNLWREASADTAHPVARSCMLNLVIFAEAADLEPVADMAAELAVHHPSRTILVAFDPDAKEASLTAEVSARCHLSFGRRQQICSEQVIVKAGGSAIDEVHAIVLPLLTSDLPSFLWWRSRRWPSGRGFLSIADASNRIILDSSMLADSPEGIRNLDGLMHGAARGYKRRFSVADLAWSRLTPWRIALAELYDLPTYRRHLDQARRFSLTYNPGSQADGHQSTGPTGIPATAMLAAGWLASRLGWGTAGTVEKSGDGYLIPFAKDIQLFISPADASTTTSDHPNPAHGGSVSELKVETAGKPASVFSIGLVDGCIQTKIVLDGGGPVSRIVGSGQTSETDLVGEELDILGYDSTYEDAVAAGASVAQKIASGGAG